MKIKGSPKRHGERGALSISACKSGIKLAERIIKSLNNKIKKEGDNIRIRRINTNEITFGNNEIKSEINENIRGDDHYIVQCFDDPLSNRSINDNLMALLTAINAAYQSDADSITAVIPQYAYSRQERKKSREGITAKQVAQFMEISGADRVITLDVHSEAIMGFFTSATMEDLHASQPLINHFKKKYRPKNLVVTAADIGGAEKARFFSKALGTDFAIVDKARDYSKTSTIESMRLVGEVKDKDVLIPDDMISTGGTIVNASKLLKDKGANDIYITCSLPFFNGHAVDIMEKAYEEGVIKQIIGTDAVFHGKEFVDRHEWYDEVSIASLFANVIYHINTKRSVSELLR